MQKNCNFAIYNTKILQCEIRKFCNVKYEHFAIQNTYENFAIQNTCENFAMQKTYILAL